MRTQLIVVFSPRLDDLSSIRKRSESVLIQAFLSQPAIEAFDESIVRWASPGRLKSSLTPLRCAHSSITFEINSDPLSTLIIFGKPKVIFSRSITSTTRLPFNEKSISIAGLTRLKLSDSRQEPEWSPI